MSSEYEAALEIKAGIDGVTLTLDRIHERLYEASANAPTRRERIATAVMIGLLASETKESGYESSQDLAEHAVIMADELIKALEAK